jgi:hypothetical protein
MTSEERLLEIMRAQGKLITLLQTECAENAGFLYVHGIQTKPERSAEAKRLREEISKLKEAAK